MFREDLWRVGDDVYDLSSFVNVHPGGAEWLELTKGTDITEAFHTCHVFVNRAEAVLAKYHVRSCSDIPRTSPYTFHPDGFYCRLRSRVADALRDVGTAPTLKMMLMADAILLTFHILMLMTAFTGSYMLAVLTGLVLGMNVSCAHNFLHQRDNFRRCANCESFSFMQPLQMLMSL